MATVLETPTVTQDAPVVMDEQSLAQKLKDQTAAVRLNISAFGTRRTLTEAQIQQAAELFGATNQVLRASKRLLDTSSKAYRKVQGIQHRAKQYWKAMSTPFELSATRLIRKDRVVQFNEVMEDFRSELSAATSELQQEYEILKANAREELGELFNPADYPADIRDSFSIKWDFPAVHQAPDYLKELHPDLYVEAQKAIEAKFEDAVKAAEEAFVEEFHKLVEHLSDRLKPDESGKRKAFHESTVGNLKDFFERFKMLNVGSSKQLDELVDQASGLVEGVTAGQLRKDVTARQSLAEGMDKVKEQLSGLVVAKTRAINLDDDE